MVSFGGLAAGLGIGTLAEFARRSLGIKENQRSDSWDTIFLTPANTERIVNTLCKVRGKIHINYYFYIEVLCI